jgi:large subunit ribosomal protein L4
MPTSKSNPKTPNKTVKKVQKTANPKTTNQNQTKAVGISAPVFDITGKSQGHLNLPKEIFGQKPNKQLLSQAIRVYFANQSTHNASTKTRAKVRGGGAKPWRQKGTGRARAGSSRSPLWVGGGVTFGPQPRKVVLNFPQKMKKKALISALSSQHEDGAIKIISNFEKIEPKTKIAFNLFKKLSVTGKTLVILDDQKNNVRLAVRNMPDTDIELSANLNAFKVLGHRNLIFSKGAIEKMGVSK